MDPTLRVRTEGDDAHPVVAIAGELDFDTAPAFEREVIELSGRGPEEVVLDLRDVAFIDSSGLRSLVLVKQVCDVRAVKLSLREPSERTRRMLDVTGLASLFES